MRKGSSDAGKSDSGEGSLGRSSHRAIRINGFEAVSQSPEQSRDRSGSQTPSPEPVKSEERGDTLNDLKTITFAIMYPQNPEYWTQVKAFSANRLEAIATYEIQDCANGQTPLHIAVACGHEAMVDLLLEHGADQYVDEFGRDIKDDADGYTALTLAVKRFWETSNTNLIEKLLEHSQHKADALCTAIRCYETEQDASKRAKYTQILDWLLNQPNIVGSKKVKPDYPAHQPPIEGCIDQPEQLQDSELPGYRALQLICYYRDIKYLDILMRKLPSVDDDKKSEQYQLDKKRNTILHIAIKQARVDNEDDANFVKHLAGLCSYLGKEVNKYQQTPLSLACEKGDSRLIIALAEAGIKLLPPLDLTNQDKEQSEDQQAYLTPLHVAVRDAKIEVLDLLLQNWSGETNVLLQHEIQCDSLIKLAMDKWRSKVLTGENDKAEVDILKKLLKFDATGRILERQLKTAASAIKQIQDTDLQTPLLTMCAKISSDYQRICYEHDDAAIAQKIKLLGLANALQQVSSVYSDKSLDASKKETAQREFIQCSRHLLYSNKVKTIFGIAVCAFLGFCVGAIIGYVVGTILTGGGPGGLVLGPPSAEYGLALGTILGCLFFGIGAGAGRYLLSDLFTWQRGLWSTTRAMNKNIKQVIDPLSIPLPIHLNPDLGSNDLHHDDSTGESLDNNVYTRLV